MREYIEQIIEEAVKSAIEAGKLQVEDVPEAALERPKDVSHGDWATSIAMRMAKSAKKNPREIAQIVVDNIKQDDSIASVEIAGPGFINIYLSNAALQETFRKVRKAGKLYGSSNYGEGAKIDVEFISANPTGPMHLGHGRWAALGDAICRVMSFSGFDVTREFYINDAGNQMNIFAESVAARYLQVAELVAGGKTLEQAYGHIIDNAEHYRALLPENCYAGAYVIDIACKIYEQEGSKWVDADDQARKSYFLEKAYSSVLKHVQDVLDSFGLHFDVWFSERTLHALDERGTSKISRTIDELDKRGYIYEKDDAKWFKTTDFGDDKDRVLVKADGVYTYFAPDIAYHKDKFDRGFVRCIDLLGADHHGYIKRIQAVGEVFDHPKQPEIIIGQLVNLFRDGKPVRMSKRTGEMVSFEELIDEVGTDATRYLMLSRSTDQAIDFDIEQAKRADSSNPVYYVQYAHARICSILRKAAKDESLSIEEIAQQFIPENADLSVLTDEAEFALSRKLSEFPDTVKNCARDLAPFRLTHYAESLAAEFHRFYTNCHVIGEDKTLTTARLYVANATRQVLENCLDLLGVSSPERM